MIENEDIIIISSMKYHDKFWVSKQQIASKLSTRNRVLFVEPRVSLMGLVIYGWSLKFWARALLNGGIQQENQALYILSPLPRMPFDRRSLVFSEINQMLLTSQIRGAAAKLGFTNPILWTFVHETHRLIGKFKEKLSIYHCVDNWMEFPWANKEIVTYQEEELARKADLVFVTAMKLYERIKPLNKNTYRIPNAVDVDLFLTLGQSIPIPRDIASIRRPIIGFVGSLDVWIDIDLLRSIAMARPDWSIVIIGPVREGFDISNLYSIRNIFLLGLKERSLLPAYLNGIDVCIIPFKLNALTQCVNPLKMYEYLASGKPVVSTDLPEVREYRNIIEIATSTEDFLKKIEKALNDNHLKREMRLQAAKENTWDARMEVFSRIIRDTMGEV